MLPIDFAPLEARLRAARATYVAGTPFPFVVLEDAIDPAVADAIAAEFADAGVAWKSYHHVNSRKRVASDVASMGSVTRAVIAGFQTPAIRDALAAMGGVATLLADPELDGAGLHETLPGGHLSMHADHLTHTTRRSWSRQLNLLWFVNRDWQPAWGGALELWDATARRCVHRIVPGFNRLVVFHTSAASLHGVPDRVTCPSGRSRKSIALYYYRDAGRPLPLRPTRYVPRPGDPWHRRVLVHADRVAVAAYSWAKRYGVLDDARVARLLRWW